jgi:hypothetical protein
MPESPPARPLSARSAMLKMDSPFHRCAPGRKLLPDFVAPGNRICGFSFIGLREKSSDRGGFCDATDGEDVGRGAGIDVKLAHRLVDIVKRALHHVLEL